MIFLDKKLPRWSEAIENDFSEGHLNLYIFSDEKVANRFHHNGTVIVIADNRDRALELANNHKEIGIYCNNKKCDVEISEFDEFIFECKTYYKEEKVFVFQDNGCC